MPSLSKELRRLLEKTIAGENGARQIAEYGAEQSLRRLAVDRHEPHTSLTTEERSLRTQLRAHGRQLGDKRDLQRGSQSIDHLTQAVAYEHWHRLLFARFLAENDLLMHPDHGVALSLEEVKEVALGLGRDWIDIASEYAQRMLLREVFRQDDPALRVPLSPERRLELENKLNLLPREIFLADDSLGWVYQFWQKDAKDRVNRSEVKIGADELPPVTQLFTEDYMVLFLLENTLGAWWTALQGKPDLPGYKWTYLRLNEDGTPVAGRFLDWPRTASDISVLDPCMGSGHFLTFALPILVRIRMHQEHLSLSEAISSVLHDNLFGLEVDLRCSQIAAFNLALTSWKLAGQHFELPSLNLACSGLSINAKEEDWVGLASEDTFAHEGMRRLYSLFSDAPTLGSLIDPLRMKTNIYASGSERIRPLIEAALAKEMKSAEDRELAIAAQGVLAAFKMLASQYTLIATNVPYLGRGKQSSLLAQFCEEFHSDAKADLATCFIDRCLSFSDKVGFVALVTPQNWLYQHHYRFARKRHLSTKRLSLLARLGPGAFETISGEVVQASLVCMCDRRSEAADKFAAWDVTEEGSPTEKSTALQSADGVWISQADQLASPDCRITFGSIQSGALLGSYASALSGMSAGDSLRFDRYFWEVPDNGDTWEFVQTTVEDNIAYGGRTGIILWEREQGQIYQFAQSVRHLNHAAQNWLRGKPNWGKSGVVVSQTGHLPVTLYQGDKYDLNCCAIVPHDPSHNEALWAFCSSQSFTSAVRNIDQSLKVTPQSLLKIPFDLERWQLEASEKYPTGLPRPHSSDPTQWLFDGRPEGSQRPLQVAMARLLGFRWPRQRGEAFPDCDILQPDGLEQHVAPDGIVCLSSVAGEESAATRLRNLLQHALGSEYALTELLETTRSKTLETWIRDEFFAEHLELFLHRPFIWHIWDGQKDGFHALVNYHKLDRHNLEKLTYSYLGAWLGRRRQDVHNGVEGADTRLAAAEHLQKELIKIFDGEKPYDIFVRWKAVDQQPIGWDPDLNDGVRLNIRPWITAAKLYKAGKPGIMRSMPNIKYTKDRGKELARDRKEFPWYGDSTDRINDHHLSLVEKRSARGLR